MKKIGILTSGGDAPGMNAAIRAVVRIAHYHDIGVLGFERGWEGLINNRFRELNPRSVSGILQLGGTILYTSRCSEFEREEGIRKAAANLGLNDIDGLVVIGGNGSMKGALALSKETRYTDRGHPDDDRQRRVRVGRDRGLRHRRQHRGE